MKNIYVILLPFFLSSITIAAESDSDKLTKLAEKTLSKENIKKKLEESANKWLAKEAPFLQVNYQNNDDNSDKDGWSLDYDWSKSKNKSKAPETDFGEIRDGDQKRFRFTSLALAANLKGSYAREKNTNANNLSNAGLSIHVNGVDQGWLLYLPEEKKEEYKDCIRSIADDSTKEEHYKQVSECNHIYFDMLRDAETHTFAYDVKFDYKKEANDDYTDHHEVIGFGTTLVFEPLRDSKLQKLNVFDYPFRVTRLLFSEGIEYNAKLPSLLIAFQEVDPTQDSVRNALPGGNKSFDRWHAEIAFSSLIASINHLPLTFESSFRVYKENSPPEAVKAANLDNFKFATASLYAPAQLFGIEGESDFYISYVHGKLPFDVNTNKAITIGWKSNFKDFFKALVD